MKHKPKNRLFAKRVTRAAVCCVAAAALISGLARADMLLLEEEKLDGVSGTAGLNIIANLKCAFGKIQFSVPGDTAGVNNGELTNFAIHNGSSTNYTEAGPVQVGTLTDPVTIEAMSSGARSWLRLKLPDNEASTGALWARAEHLKFGGVSFGALELRNIKQRGSSLWAGPHTGSLTDNGLDLMLHLSMHFDQIRYSSTGSGTGIDAVFQDVVLRDAFTYPVYQQFTPSADNAYRPEEAPTWVYTGGIMRPRETVYGEADAIGRATSGTGFVRLGLDDANPAMIDFAGNNVIQIKIPVDGSLRMRHAWYGNSPGFGGSSKDYGYLGIDGITGTVYVRFPYDIPTGSTWGWQY
jgi:hypothetical protein